MKNKFLPLLFLITLVDLKQLHAETKSHEDHSSAVGIHGMSLLEANGDLFASHMPLHNSIHAYQVILKVSFRADEEIKIIKLIEDNKLISLRPELFDLNQLINGELMSFNTDIFIGHFERNGKIAIADVRLKVDRMVLSKPIDNFENGRFYNIPLDDNLSLLVHRIGNLPSFDQILLANRREVTQSDVNTLINPKVSLPLDQKGLNDTFMQQGFYNIIELYLETEDFH
ncbi:hypothetical protein FLL45_11255 [Aliikangiella marina]|uniref:Uncharacterized protein n=1 Tax=Aliikangiella marina TaxID=1712262 RepID=A0A545TE91_9GAMM|nr:hypothetical protein [Aliikangiella marina]TQV75486.1 hypothetical protein FLL45_11255 [Aliikangiella marina]